MPTVTPPGYVKQILVTLRSRGHLAYLVGGCVRDILLGVRPHDWDICTSALPEEVMGIFPGSLPTGVKHGTVTVRLRSRQVEVTTFRSDGSYSDHRHPEAVRFVGDLNTDLSRRDFTMNAIALPPDGLLCDPFGGVQDIRDGLIRCVGEPERRFEEDALRMLRALRFSARLGFTVEKSTMAAILEKAPLAAGLAAERVRDEVEKILLTPAPQTAVMLISCGLLDRYLLCRTSPEAGALRRLTRLPKKALYRWAALCTLLERGGAICSTREFLTALRLDSRTIRCCEDCVQLLSQPAPESRVAWKRMLNRYGVDTVSVTAACGDALFGGHSRNTLREILRSGECFSLRHLAVGGEELAALGLSGRALGEMLDFLLEYVMEYPENNRRELLLSLVHGTEE